jgi:putative hydrolase of the HAD superfamily
VLRFALLDLDNTIYPPTSGLWEAIGERINLFMVDRLGIDPEVVKSRREEYLRSFGTTLMGLRVHHEVQAEEFLEFVHDVPLDRFLRPDPALDAMLGRLPVEKVILTNADAPHARRVLSHLGVERHFETIIDIHALEFVNKPDPRAYKRALALIGARPEECLFVDDTPLNLAAARDLGIHSILLTTPGSTPDGNYPTIGSLLELEPLLADRMRARSGSAGS